jgi:hypothetical protein
MDPRHDTGIAVRLRRLEASSAADAPFSYDDLMNRHATRAARAQRRHRLARAAAGVLVVAFVGASVWRLGPADVNPDVPGATIEEATADVAQPRIVRADTYLALAALEDHIARVDDALNVARLSSPRGAEVARLERTRNELLDSYAQVRYAELVSANF